MEAILRESGLEHDGVLECDAAYWIVETEQGASEPVGVIGAEWGERAALLRSAAVRPAWRGRGCSRQLVDRVIAEARGRELRAVYLFSTGAVSYWPRLGFVGVPVEELVGELPEATQVRAYQVAGTLCCERAWKLHL